MNRLSILASMLAMVCLPMMAQKTGSKVQEKPDPNFQIYLCFGQSNMEGNAAIEDIDRTGVNPRFQAMYAVDDEKAGWKKGQWHTAVPPQARPLKDRWFLPSIFTVCASHWALSMSARWTPLTRRSWSA